jgi:hypothetical protein
MKADKQLKSYIYSIYAYEQILTDEDRAAFADIEYRPALGELLFLLAVSEIELATYRLCRRKGEKLDSQIAEFYSLCQDGRHIPNGEKALNVCIKLALGDNFEKLNFTVSASIANMDGVKLSDEYYFFDDTAYELARKFGLHFCLFNKDNAMPLADEQLDEYQGNLIPQNAEMMYYVNLLRGKTAFIELFAEDYKSGEKSITANLPDEYETFVQQMNAIYTVSVYSRSRNVFSSAGLIKQYDFKAVEGLQSKEVKLDVFTEDESLGEQQALTKFVGEQTVKQGNVLKISRNGNHNFYYYTLDNAFKRIPNFETLPVDPDKIWEYLKKFKLFSTYAKELPPDIAEGLSETEQQYARYIIANQLQSPTEKGVIKKRVSLDEMITHVLNPETIEEINRRKNGSDGENTPI